MLGKRSTKGVLDHTVLADALTKVRVVSVKMRNVAAYDLVLTGCTAEPAKD